MARKTATLALLAAGLVIAAPAAAQTSNWSADRPDGHAPLGIRNGFTLNKGQALITYRYIRDEFEDSRIGTTPLGFNDVLVDFGVAPLTRTSEAHVVELRLGVTDDFSVAASVPLLFQAALQTTGATIFETNSEGVGDVELTGMYRLFQKDGTRANVSFGISLPTGSIDEVDPNSPLAGTGQLPFSMQSGTGSLGITPGATFQTQNDRGTVGIQAFGNIGLERNDRNYASGDRFTGTLWASVKVSEWISASARLLVETWEDVEGFDPETDGTLDPSANPFAQGGTRTQIPFGINIHFQEGVLAGQRLAFEWYYPVHQDLNGPQLEADQRFVVGLQFMF